MNFPFLPVLLYKNSEGKDKLCDSCEQRIAEIADVKVNAPSNTTINTVYGYKGWADGKLECEHVLHVVQELQCNH